MSKQNKKKQKIIWVTLSPNMIYVNIFNEFARKFPENEFVMVVSSPPKVKVYFEVRVLPVRKIPSKMLFPHRAIVNFFRGRHKDLQTVNYMAGLRTLLLKEKPDMLLSNIYWKFFTITAYRYAVKQKIPFVLFEEKRMFRHSSLEKLLTKVSFFLLSGVFQYSQKILCWTDEGVEFGKKYFPVRNKEKISRVYAGVDTDLFYPQVRKEKDRGPLRFLIVARFVRIKRHADLLEAFAKAQSATTIPMKLGILGNGLLEKEIKEHVYELNLKNSVVFLEQIPQGELVNVYHAYDCLVLPSSNEGIGMVVPEAMASGLPVIVSDAVGAKDYVREGVDGYIFKMGDIEDLTEKLLLMFDKKKCKDMGENAVLQIQNSFSVQVVSKKLSRFLLHK